MSASSGLLLQAGPLAALEFFPCRRSENEHHAYLRGLSVAEWASLFRSEISTGAVYAFAMPASSLNPAYWTPHSEEGERELRERLGGVIEREEHGLRRIWRADRVPPGRILRDGLVGSPEILPGLVFKFSGPDFVQTAQALTDSGEPARILVAATATNGQDRETTFLSTGGNDLRHMRLSMREERMLFASDGDGMARLVFAEPSHAQTTLEGALRGVFHRLSGRHVTFIRRQVLAHLLSLADRVGFSADPARDFIDKDRSLELTLHLGKTIWPAEREITEEDPRVLVYYDRTSGIWEAIPL